MTTALVRFVMLGLVARVWEGYAERPVLALVGIAGRHLSC